MKHSNCRGAKLTFVIEVTVLEGEGVEGDPMREARYYYDAQGKLLAFNDPDIERVKNI